VSAALFCCRFSKTVFRSIKAIANIYLQYQRTYGRSGSDKKRSMSPVIAPNITGHGWLFSTVFSLFLAIGMSLFVAFAALVFVIPHWFVHLDVSRETYGIFGSSISRSEKTVTVLRKGLTA